MDSDPEVVYTEKFKKKITPVEWQALKESIAKKMAPTPVKLRAGFELNCFTYEGIDAIKEALLTAKLAVNDKQFVVEVIVFILVMVNTV